MTEPETGDLASGDALHDALAAMPEGWSVTIQHGDDYGSGPWYAVAENTLELPGQPTGRLGYGETPDEALRSLAVQLRRAFGAPPERLLNAA